MFIVIIILAFIFDNERANRCLSAMDALTSLGIDIITAGTWYFIFKNIGIACVAS